MKKAFLIGIVLTALLHPDGYSQKSRNQIKLKADSVAVDSVEYELLVLDPGFDVWLASKPSKNFYSKEYYELKNRFYVIEWNIRYSSPMHYKELYETRIDYDPDTDYGLELNYRLYYYFKYFEETNHVRLIDQGR